MMTARVLTPKDDDGLSHRGDPHAAPCAAPPLVCAHRLHVCSGLQSGTASRRRAVIRRTAPTAPRTRGARLVDSCFTPPDFDVLFSYLTCGNYDFRYDLAKGLRPRRSIKTAMAHEIMFYGISQKDGLGLDRAVEEVKYRMSRYGVSPNMMIIPPQLALYLAMAPDEKTLYPDGGTKAVGEFDSGMQGFTSRSFRGLSVVTSEPFEVADGAFPFPSPPAARDPRPDRTPHHCADQDSVQMLTRNSQVGEFYVMGPPPVPPKPGSRGFMDMLIYDEEADRHVRITWEDAYKACCVDQVGNDLGHGLGKADFKAWAEAWDAVNQVLDRVGGNAISVEAHATALKDLYASKKEVYVVVARPFIEHLMHSAVVAVAGKDTGATLFGPAGEFDSRTSHDARSALGSLLGRSPLPPTPPCLRAVADMQISANTQVKTIEVSGAAALTDGAPHPAPHPPAPRSTRIRIRLHPACGNAGPLHWPLQVRRHQAAERLRGARHRVWRLRGRRKLHILCQG